MERKLYLFGHIRRMSDDILVKIIMFKMMDGKSVKNTTKGVKLVHRGLLWHGTTQMVGLAQSPTTWRQKCVMYWTHGLIWMDGWNMTVISCSVSRLALSTYTTARTTSSPAISTTTRRTTTSPSTSTTTRRTTTSPSTSTTTRRTTSPSTPTTTRRTTTSPSTSTTARTTLSSSGKALAYFVCCWLCHCRFQLVL